MFASKDELFTRPSGYSIARSVRLRSSASGYFNRTPASAGNQKTWTLSWWVKRGTFGSIVTLFSCGTSTDVTEIRFSASSTLEILYTNNDYALISNRVFRDPSAYMQLTVVMDTTQATASNRLRAWVNNDEITSWSTDNRASLTQNSNQNWNGARAHNIGRYNPGASNYFDGYITEINFIDGQALTPSSFGTTNAITGVWQPAKYTGIYGTNGFYLNFSDNSNNTAATIGKDYSGNGNNWTPNNISVTAGATYDSMVDSPTVGATSSNYAVINPLLVGDYFASGQTTFAITNGNLNYGATGRNAFGSIAVSSGKWYWEMVNTSNTTAATALFGVVTVASRTSVYACYYNAVNGNKGLGTLNSGATETSYGATWSDNDVIGVAVDMDAATPTVTFYKNNTSQGAISVSSFVGQSVMMWVQNGGNTNNMSGNVNFGQRPFSYTPPTGYVALNTYNLPASTIVKGNTVMDATLYTGTLVSNAVTNTAGFKPDLVWIKSRSAATDNKLTDSLRGVTKAFISNLADGETTDTQGLTAFNSNGFTVGTNTIYNNLSATYVAWQWQAGQGSSASNTSGSITSTVSKNTTAGFSIVTYSGNSTSGATIGHGLGVTPNLIIVKRLNATLAQSPNAIVYVTPLGNTKGLILDTTLAEQTAAGFWNNTSPTSSVFSVGNDANTNVTSFNYVAYCFAAVAGYSAFGSYTGNGSTDGPFIYTGFRPRFILFKRTDTTADWRIEDTSRSPTNATQIEIYPNLSNAEGSAPDGMDILSNGFKLRGSYAQWNASGGTFIYAAFAENPFKNSLAR